MRLIEMALAQIDIEQIEEIVQRIIENRPETRNTNVRYDLDLRERSIRVEEELKHQRELMSEGFKQMEKRFEQVDKRFEQVDKRFEQVDKRFESMQLEMNKRFEQVDKRFDQQHQEIMNIHQEIKLLMRWGFGSLLGISGLVVAILKLI
jgi:hypothetical protein